MLSEFSLVYSEIRAPDELRLHRYFCDTAGCRATPCRIGRTTQAGELAAAAAAACGWLPLSELCIALDQARCLSRAAAAHYCGVSKSGFDEWVRRGIVPGPGTQRWDRKAIDLALDRASGIRGRRCCATFSLWSRVQVGEEQTCRRANKAVTARRRSRRRRSHRQLPPPFPWRGQQAQVAELKKSIGQGKGRGGLPYKRFYGVRIDP